MQRISRAPELSATRSLVSFWITAAPRSSSRPLQHVDEGPPLGPRQGPALDHPHDIPLVGVVVLVVGVHGARAADDLLVAAVAAGHVDPDRDRLLRLVGDDHALANPAGALHGGVDRSKRLGGWSGGAALGGLRPFAESAGPAPERLLAALLHALGVALLRRAGRARLLRPRASLAPAALLRRELLDGLSGGRRSSLLDVALWGLTRGLLAGGLGLLGGRLLGGGLLAGSLLLGGGLWRLLAGVVRLGGRLLGGVGALVVFLVSHVFRFLVLLGGLQRAGLPPVAAVRSRTTVSARARSRLARDRAAVSSSSPVALEKRRPKISRRR